MYCCGNFEVVASNFFHLCTLHDPSRITKADLIIFVKYMQCHNFIESRHSAYQEDENIELQQAPMYPKLMQTAKKIRLTLTDSTLSNPSIQNGFSEIILERHSLDKIGLLLNEFTAFLLDYPEIFSRLSNIFKEYEWKDIQPKLTFTDSIVSKIKDITYDYSDTLFVSSTSTEPLIGAIRRSLLIICRGNKKNEILDVICLNGCYLKVERDECEIYQFDHAYSRLVFTAKSVQSLKNWITSLAAAGNMREFEYSYSLGPIIGKGAFSDVRIAKEKHKNTEWGAKIITRKKNFKEKTMISNEVRILQSVSHSNIVAFKEVITAPTYTFIISELIEGLELTEMIPTICEAEVKILITQLLDALNYIHELGIIHRDLKPENILVLTNSESLQLKLIDFGLSVFALPDEVFYSICGTIGYTAPEMYSRQGYGKAVDLWSVGVITYTLLVKDKPFKGDNYQKVVKKTMKAKPNFSRFHEFTEGAQDFVKKLLKKDPTKRMTASNALKHAWLID